MCGRKIYRHGSVGCDESPVGSRGVHRSDKVLASDGIEDDIKSRPRRQTFDIRLDLFFAEVDNFIGPQAAHQIEIFIGTDRGSNLTSKRSCELNSDITYSTSVAAIAQGSAVPSVC